MNKSVLISNLEVLTKELSKVELEIGKEYAKTLASSNLASISKEEFYLENCLVVLMDAIENIEMLTFLLKEKSPEYLVKTAEDDGRDFRSISMEMKHLIVSKKLEENPMLGLMATLEAISRMAKETKK